MKYGFYTEAHPNGTEIRTLGTGDGKTMFTPINYRDGTSSVAIAYGAGEGLNTTTDHGGIEPDGSFNIDLQIKFECHASADALIRAVMKAKEHIGVISEINDYDPEAK